MSQATCRGRSEDFLFSRIETKSRSICTKCSQTKVLMEIIRKMLKTIRVKVKTTKLTKRSIKRNTKLKLCKTKQINKSVNIFPNPQTLLVLILQTKSIKKLTPGRNRPLFRTFNKTSHLKMKLVTITPQNTKNQMIWMLIKDNVNRLSCLKQLMTMNQTDSKQIN